MGKTKQTKGITLVALVITIILLLILAGISILAITNQGLFAQADEAKRKTENAQAEEGETLADYENSIVGYISGNRDINGLSMTELLNEPAIVPTSKTEASRDLNFNLKDSILNYKVLIITYGVWNNNLSKISLYDTRTLPVSQIEFSDDCHICIEQRFGANFSAMEMEFTANNNLHVSYSQSSNSNRTRMDILSVIGIK